MDKPLLDLYADYLISSFGPTTATGLSRLLDAGLSHDKITRFLAGEAMTSQNLWQIVKPLVRQVQNEDAVLVVDDSIVHKPYTDENDLICWHYDHATEQTVKGINFVTALYCAPQKEEENKAPNEAEDVSLPVAFLFPSPYLFPSPSRWCRRPKLTRTRRRARPNRQDQTGKTKQARPSGAIPSARTSMIKPCSKPVFTIN